MKVLRVTIVAMLVITLLALLMIGVKEEREMSLLQMSESDVKDSINAFSIKIFSRLNHDEQNVIFSPFSVFSALAMTYEGARGETAGEIANVLCLPSGSPAEGYRNLSRALLSNEALKIANAVWVQTGFPIKEEYLDKISVYYGGTAESIDFAFDPEGAREKINSYVEERTEGKIEDLLPKGSIDPLTKLVITNAVHFKGTWKYKFDPSATFEGDFKTHRGVVKVMMMRMTPEVRLNYSDAGRYEVLELPYESKLSTLIFLPKEGEGLNLTPEDLRRAIDSMRGEEFDEVIVPKFEISSDYDLNGLLISLGMRKAFDQQEADFTGIYEKEKVSGNLYVSLVKHKAYVKVDEEGTEAAGATGVVMKLTAVRERKVFSADRPFIFLILDKETGALLFIGSLVDPTA